MPESEFLLFSQHLELVTLSKGRILFGMGEWPSYVYYPLDALVSMVLDLPEGTGVVANLLDNTCAVGASAVDEPSFYRATVLTPGLAYRMPAHVFKSLRAVSPGYMLASSLSLVKLLSQISQTLVCSKHHSKEQQLVRWLLMTLDRSPTFTIKITQQEIADLLGFRREAVSLVIQLLVVRKEIVLSRGQITVLSRNALTKASCACYSHMRVVGR